eukprot:294828_1
MSRTTPTEPIEEGVTDGTSSSWKILFNVPNTIGHVRLLLLLGFVLLDTIDIANGSYAQVCCLMLSLSIFLDVLDGMAARALDQCTKFGYHYDIFLDGMLPIVVYGQCQNNALLKSFAGVFSFACTFWCLLAMSTSWKVGNQPKYWPASAVTTKNNGGQFTFFGSMLWYFGFAGSFPMIYAIDRNLIEFGFVAAFVLAFAMLDLLSLIEHNGMYIQSLLEVNNGNYREQQCGEATHAHKD